MMLKSTMKDICIILTTKSL